jgi:hypothetical protein
VIGLPAGVKVFLACGRTDMRKGMDGLAIQVELSPNFGDGLRVQAAAVWDFEDAELATTSIPSVNLTP